MLGFLDQRVLELVDRFVRREVGHRFGQVGSLALQLLHLFVCMALLWVCRNIQVQRLYRLPRGLSIVERSAAVFAEACSRSWVLYVVIHLL